eukprot:452061_1
MCCNQCCDKLCMFYFITDNSKKPVISMVCFVLIVMIPILIWLEVVYVDELKSYDNHFEDYCSYIDMGPIIDCEYSSGKVMKEGVQREYYFTSVHCDYTLVELQECLEKIYAPHEDGTCYILKCDGDNDTSFSWDSSDYIIMKIGLVAASMFVDLVLLILHFFGYRYYKKKSIEEQSNNETDIQNNIEIQTQNNNYNKTHIYDDF